MTDIEFENNIQMILSGDKEGLKNIYTEYISFIYRITYDVLMNKTIAEDVTSEFFIKLWNNSDKYKTGNGHKMWLARIARNMAIDYLRKYKKEFLSDETYDVSYDDTENTVLDNIALQETLSCLKEKERQIVNMKIVANLTFKEISKILGLPMGTVTWRYQNAINKLRRCMSNE